MTVRCEGCGCVLGRHNPFFVVEDGIRLCAPCRSEAWTPEPPPSPVRMKGGRERPTVTRQQHDEKIARALPAKVCECPVPIPMGDEDVDSCIRCAKRIPADWAEAA